MTDSEDDYRTGCRNVSHGQQQQSYSGLRSPAPDDQTQPTFGFNFIKNHSDFTGNTSLFLSPIVLSTGQITIQ